MNSVLPGNYIVNSTINFMDVLPLSQKLKIFNMKKTEIIYMIFNVSY